jgi:hypothetical protein
MTAFEFYKTLAEHAGVFHLYHLIIQESQQPSLALQPGDISSPLLHTLKMVHLGEEKM